MAIFTILILLTQEHASNILVEYFIKLFYVPMCSTMTPTEYNILALNMLLFAQKNGRFKDEQCCFGRLSHGIIDFPGGDSIGTANEPENICEGNTFVTTERGFWYFRSWKVTVDFNLTSSGGECFWGLAYPTEEKQWTETREQNNWEYISEMTCLPWKGRNICNSKQTEHPRDRSSCNKNSGRVLSRALSWEKVLGEWYTLGRKPFQVSLDWGY